MNRKCLENRPITTKPTALIAPGIVVDDLKCSRMVNQVNPRNSMWQSYKAVAIVAVSLVCASASAPGQDRLSYDEWIRGFQGLSVPERSWKADPDLDGIPNLGEQLHNMDPSLGGPSDPNWDNAPRVWLDGSRRPEFRYHVDPKLSAAGTIGHQPYSSGDLTKWEAAYGTADEKGNYVVPPNAKAPSQFFRVEYQYNPPADADPSSTFSARSVRWLGNYNSDEKHPWNLANTSLNSYRTTHTDRWTNIRGGIDKVAANFLVEGDDVPFAIMLTADCFVDGAGKRMFVRLLVDGKPMAPEDVVLAVGNKLTKELGTRSFEFTGVFDRGLHTVEAQWMIDKGGIGYMSGAGLLVRQADFLAAVTPESGLNIESEEGIWLDVPGLEVDVTTEKGELLTATFSAEAYTESGGTMVAQVLVDGMVANPGPVVFVSDGFQGARSMAFGMEGLDPGTHEVKVQYLATSGKIVGLGDRTLTVSAGDDVGSSPVRQWFLTDNDWLQPKGPDINTTVFEQDILLPPDSDLSVIFSASIRQPSPAWEHFVTYAVLTIDGVPVPGSETLLTASENPYGTHAVVFDAKHINAGKAETLSKVAVKWKVFGKIESDPPAMSARSMIIYAKQHAVPDLAEAPALGNGYVIGKESNFFKIEPAIGKRNVLVILIEPKGIGNPVPKDLAVPKDLSGNGEPMPSISDLEEAFFGPNDSAADYFHEVSGGRLQLVNAGVLGPYETDMDWDFYYKGPPGTWDGAGSYSDLWSEAVTKAEELGEFKYSDYDYDGDGYLSPTDELAIVVVKPQLEARGYHRYLWGETTPITHDGVYLDMIVDLYSSNPMDDYMLYAHELGHQILRLSDLYPPESANGSEAPTRAGAYALMDYAGQQGSESPHVNPAYKLALGWASPRIITQDTYAISLVDVKVSREVVVLPRIPSMTEDEYLVLETRLDPPNDDKSLYDSGLPDSGLAVWHIIENFEDSGDAPPSCSSGNWSSQTGDDIARRGIRLIRPTATYETALHLWNADQYDLDPFGFSCDPPHNVSLWADGAPGYSLRNFSEPGASMAFDVEAP